MNSSHRSRIVALIAALCLVLGCNDTMDITNAPHIPPDNIVPTYTYSSNCSLDTVYFQNDIFPLVNALCGNSGCHGSVNPHSPSLTAYSQIFTQMGSPSKLNTVLASMAGWAVTTYVPPTAVQLATLQKWTNQGAKNNSCTSCDTTRFTYHAEIAPMLATYCNGCHNATTATAGVDLSTYAAVKANLLDHPGQLMGSIAWTAPYTGAQAMPPGIQLPACKIDQVRKWIYAGALNN